MTNYLEKEMNSEIERIDADVRDNRWWRRVQRLRVLNALFVDDRKKPVASETNERREQAGYSWLSPVSFALLIVAFVVCLLWQLRPQTTFYSYPDDYLRVIQNIEPCDPDGTCGHRRIMQEVVNGTAQPAVEMNFCQKPRFEAGHILQWVRTSQRGPCTDIDGFDVVRATDITFIDGGWHKLPQIAPNCSFDWPHNHVACTGGIARF